MPALGGNVRTAETRPSYVLGKPARETRRGGGQEGPGEGPAVNSGCRGLECSARLGQGAVLSGGLTRSTALPGGGLRRTQAAL